MTYATVFSLSFLAVVPLWGLMVFAPRWSWTRRIVTEPLAYAPLAVVYTVLVAVNAAEVVPVIVADPRLETVAPLLATPAGATIAWVHFLAFDVFVGRWIYLDAQERGRHPLLTAPVLVLSLMFGPVGFLSYLVLRSLATDRRISEAGRPIGSPHG